MLRTLFALFAAVSFAVPALGQIPDNLTFFDYDFTATDQMTAKFGDSTIPGGDAAGQPADNGGIFDNTFVNRGPFVDGALSTQVGFANSTFGDNWTVDTANGFVAENPDAPTNYQTQNIFIGQPKLVVGDTVRLISELSFSKPLIEDPDNAGSFIEGNSAFDNYFFGFRGGIGTSEFAPNDGVSHAFRYNLGADASDDSDSTIQVFANANNTSALSMAGDGNVGLGAVSDLGIDIANNDFDTDIFRIVTDAVVTATSPTLGITFDITTSIENEAGTELGATPTATTITDTSITLADDRIQFAVRDGNSGPSDPVNVKIHRLAAIFNPTDSPALLGDFDNDGDVDLDDLDEYNQNIGMAATGDLEPLDLNDDGTVGLDDFVQHYETLVETSNGGKGTAAGDVNLDGVVNVLGDAFALVGNLNNPATSWSQGDLNADGTVNVLGDAFLLVGNLGADNGGAGSAPSTSSVPEPGSLSLLALAGLSSVIRRRR